MVGRGGFVQRKVAYALQLTYPHNPKFWCTETSQRKDHEQKKNEAERARGPGR